MTGIDFQIYDWNSYDDYTDEKNPVYAMQIFGRTRCDKDVCLKVTDYRPFLYVEIPEKWNTARTGKFVDGLINQVKWKTSNNSKYDFDVSDSLVKYSIEKKKKFMYFTAGKDFSFLKLEFSNLASYREYKYLLRRKVPIANYSRKKELFQLYEADIDPIMKYMHISNIKSCGNVIFDPSKSIPIPEYSKCDYSYEVRYNALKPLPDSEVPTPFKVLAYDIECVSGDTLFPQATRPTDKVIQIGMTVNRFGSSDISEKYILTLKRCSEIPGAVVKCYSSEKFLLLGFFDMLNVIRPDIISGYNNFGFDDKYIYDRLVFLDSIDAKEAGVIVESLPERLTVNNFIILGKLNNKYIMEKENLEYSQSRYITKSLNSGALGDNQLYYFEIPGIVSFDMLKTIKREHTGINSYKLGDISGHFISEKISDISFKKIGKNKIETVLTTCSVSNLAEGAYIQIFYIEYNKKSLKDDAKYLVRKIEKTGNNFNITVILSRSEAKTLKKSKNTHGHKQVWGFSKDDLHYSYITEYFNDGNPEKIKEVAKYCIKDCELVNILIMKLDVVMTIISMANVSGVPFSYINLRGQSVKALSIVTNFCARAKHLMPSIARKDGDIEDSYEGAIVIDPVVGIYKSPIVVLDFNSLYPNSMRDKNLSHECLVKDPKYDNLPGYVYRDIQYVARDANKQDIMNPDGTPLLVTQRFAQKIVSNEEVENALDSYLSVIRRKYDLIIQNIRNGFVDFDKYIDTVIGFYSEDKKSQQILEAAKVSQDMTSKKFQDVFRKKMPELMEFQAQLMEEEIHNEKLKHYRYDNGKWLEYGIMPTVLTFLLNSRADAKAKLAEAVDPFIKKIYDGMQLSYKITANSIYGQCGAPTSKLYMVEIAACTTAIGRNKLCQAAEITTKNFPDAQIIYGDTDSIFVNYNIEKTKKGLTKTELIREAMRLGAITAKLINKEIPLPQKIVYEKTFCPLILEKRKKYDGLRYDFDPTSYTRVSMGGVLKRRDNAPIVKDVVGTLLDNIMRHLDIQLAVDKAHKIIMDVIDEKYPMSSFIMTMGLRAMYAKPKSVAHKVLADRIAIRDPGNKPQANDRINYAYICKDFTCKRKSEILQGDMIETPEYIKEHGLKINYQHYIERQIAEPTSRYLKLVIPKRQVDNYFKGLISLARARAMGSGDISKFASKNRDYVPHPFGFDLNKYMDNNSSDQKKRPSDSEKRKPSILDFCSGDKVPATKKKHRMKKAVVPCVESNRQVWNSIMC